MTPNVQVVFRWITDVAWFGKVEVFDNPYGTGAPIVTKRSVDPSGEAVAATHQDIMVPMVMRSGLTRPISSASAQPIRRETIPIS